MKRTAGLLIIASSLVFAAGCGKKEEPAKSPSPPDNGQQATGMLDQAKETVTAAADELKQAFTTQVNLDKSVAALKAEAEKMDVATLREVAGKYKEAILAKQDDFNSVSEKLAAIPLTQRLGDEAKQLTADAQKLTESLKALTDRFNVYLNAIKAQGGDVSGLTI